LEIFRIQSELQVRVPGIVDLTCENAAAVSEGLPAVLRLDVQIDPARFDRDVFEQVIADFPAEFVRVGDSYRGSFLGGSACFRIALVVAPGVAQPRRGFWFLAPVSDVEGDRIAVATDQALNLACHHLIDASMALAFGDPESARLYIAYAQNQVLTCLAMQARRASSTAGAFVPFGPYRTVAATMMTAGASSDAFVETLKAIEATWLLGADFRRYGDPPPSPALEALRRVSVSPREDDGGQPTWYNRHAVAIYDEVRELPSAVTQIVAEVIKDLGLRTAVEIGCGTGRLSLAVAPACERIYCVDSSREMLAHLRGKIGDRDHIVPLLASMGTTGLPAMSVDAVLEFEAFYLFPNPARLCREICRVLRPGGAVMRVVKIERFDPTTERSFQRFDQTIAAHSPDGICFVGENIDAAVDAELEKLGIRSSCFRMFTTELAQTVEASLAARCRRAFPYLTHVPEAVVSAAYASARSIGRDRTSHVLSDYYAVIGFNEANATRVERVAHLLERFVPQRWELVPGVPRS
jgi:ubiquinone/menaquinone biosynthesis C-methylase UbiE